MIVLYLILLAVLQAVTEFLPVSSFGHLCVVESLLGISHDTGLLLEAMLHLGTAAAIIFLFKKYLKRLGVELLGMFMDLIGNLNLYIHNKRTGAELKYARIVTGNYRKFTVLLLVSMIPTVLLGLTARRLTLLTADSPLFSGIGFLLSGIFLLVTDLNKSGGTKGPREASYDSAMWIGICQGLSVFPGFSRSGMTISAGLMSGFSRTFAVKYSYILSIPAIIGALIMELGQFGSADMTVGLGFSYVFGMIIAAVRACLRLVHNGKFRFFAYYCFIVGIIALVANFA